MTVRELGHLVLYVRDLGRSAAFYRDVLGWHQILPGPGEAPVGAAAFSSGRTHHELLLIEVGTDATPIPSGRRVGLYHFGLNVGETDDDLRAVLDTVQKAGRHHRRFLRPHGDPQPLHPRSRRQRDRALRRRTRCGLAGRTRARRRPRPPPPALTGPAAAPAPAPAHDRDRATRVVRADDEGQRTAAEVLRAGGVAVVPTDTVYGLAARPDDADAVRAVYRAKGRPEGMHLPVLAASVAQVRALGVTFTPARRRAGPALVARTPHAGLRLRFRDVDRPAWLDGREEVAVRIPDHDFLLALLRAHGRPARHQCQPSRRADAAHGPGRAGRPRAPPSTSSSMADRSRRPLDARQRARGPAQWSSARGPSRATASRQRWRRSGDPVRSWPSRRRATRRRRPSSMTRYEVRSSVVASQIDLHADFGGVVPELASRAHVETITPIVEQALHEAGVAGGDLDRRRGHVRPGPGRGPPGRHRHGQVPRSRLGRPDRGRQPPGGPPGQRVPGRPRGAVPPDAAPGLRGPLHAHPRHRAGALRAARRDGRRLHRRGLRQGGPVSRLGLSGWTGPRSAGRLGEGRPDFPRPMLADGYEFSFSGLKTAVVNYVRKEPGFSSPMLPHRSSPPAWMCCAPSSAERWRSSVTRPWPSSAAWPPALSCGPGAGPRRRVRHPAADPAPVVGHRQRRHDRHRRVAQTRRGRPERALASAPSPTSVCASPSSPTSWRGPTAGRGEVMTRPLGPVKVSFSLALPVIVQPEECTT